MSGYIVVPSINPAPEAIATMRKNAPNAHIIVVGDKKAPDELRDFCEFVDAQYLGVEEQLSLPYKSAEFVPWNCIMRRNLGTLEAIRQGADFIIAADDDNHPRHEDWYANFASLTRGTANVPMVQASDGWFNVGDMAYDKYTSRGFPQSQRRKYVSNYSFAGGSAEVGIANGFIYGDPDINATERMERRPSVNGYKREIEYGVLVEPSKVWTAINTQNTVYRKELLPLAFVLPNVGRYDDIWAMYIAQRVMEATDYAVFFGPPGVTQDRNDHNIYRDLKDELMGMEHTDAFCACLKKAPIYYNVSVLYNLQIVAEHIAANWKASYFPNEFLQAWISDVEALL